MISCSTASNILPSKDRAVITPLVLAVREISANPSGKLPRFVVRDTFHRATGRTRRKIIERVPLTVFAKPCSYCRINFQGCSCKKYSLLSKGEASVAADSPRSLCTSYFLVTGSAADRGMLGRGGFLMANQVRKSCVARAVITSILTGCAVVLMHGPAFGQINGFNYLTGWTYNQADGGAPIDLPDANTVHLTTGNGEARSIFNDVQQNIGSGFTTSFIYQATNINPCLDPQGIALVFKKASVAPQRSVAAMATSATRGSHRAPRSSCGMTRDQA